MSETAIGDTQTARGRRWVACMAAMEAWRNCSSPTRAIKLAFDDDGLTPTEEELSLGLEAVRAFKAGPGLTMAGVAARLA